MSELQMLLSDPTIQHIREVNEHYAMFITFPTDVFALLLVQYCINRTILPKFLRWLSPRYKGYDGETKKKVIGYFWQFVYHVAAWFIFWASGVLHEFGTWEEKSVNDLVVNGLMTPNDLESYVIGLMTVTKLYTLCYIIELYSLDLHGYVVIHHLVSITSVTLSVILWRDMMQNLEQSLDIFHISFRCMLNNLSFVIIEVFIHAHLLLYRLYRESISSNVYFTLTIGFIAARIYTYIKAIYDAYLFFHTAKMMKDPPASVWIMGIVFVLFILAIITVGNFAHSAQYGLYRKIHDFEHKESGTVDKVEDTIEMGGGAISPSAKIDVV